jgi:hypothetical protein
MSEEKRSGISLSKSVATASPGISTPAQIEANIACLAAYIFEMQFSAAYARQ